MSSSSSSTSSSSSKQNDDVLLRIDVTNNNNANNTNNAKKNNGTKNAGNVTPGIATGSSDPTNIITDKQIDMLVKVLQMLSTEDLDILIVEGGKRHAPLYAIEAFSDATNVLKRIESILPYDIRSSQFGGAPAAKKSSSSKKDSSKKGTKKTSKSLTVKVGNKDKKKTTSVSKSDIVDCNIISKTYRGDSNVEESLNRLTTIMPWYEYCMYTFRYHVLFQELDKSWSKDKDFAVYDEYLRRLRYALLVYTQMQHNYNYVYREITRLHKKIDESRVIGASGVVNNNIKGFFYIRDNRLFHPIRAEGSNSDIIKEAFLNRSLEYVDFISIDRFLITFNTLFTTLVYEYTSGSSWPTTFDMLEYSSYNDTFIVYYGGLNVVLEFRISPDGGYPRPVNYKMYNKSFGNSYGGFGIGGATAYDTSATVTIYSGGAEDMQALLDQWIQVDAYNLKTGR